jgi:hypothetical protein
LVLDFFRLGSIPRPGPPGSAGTYNRAYSCVLSNNENLRKPYRKLVPYSRLQYARFITNSACLFPRSQQREQQARPRRRVWDTSANCSWYLKSASNDALACLDHWLCSPELLKWIITKWMQKIKSSIVFKHK